MSEAVFAVGAAVHGVPVVVDAERVSALEAQGRRVHTCYPGIEGEVRTALEWDGLDAGSGASWPGCGCGSRCRSCGSLEVVFDASRGAVLDREGP